MVILAGLEAFLGPLGAILAPLGVILVGLEAFLGPLGPILEPLGAVLGRSWGLLRRARSNLALGCSISSFRFRFRINLCAWAWFLGCPGGPC